MELTQLKFEKEGAIATLTISRPSALNALNSQFFKEFNFLLDSIENDGEIRVLIVTGEGKAFVAGADITEMAKMNSIQAKQFASIGSSLFDKIESLPFPTIAAINGYALGGGCELALACDIRIASDNAKIGLPEVSLGITPGFGGTVRLTKLVGKAIAMELICTASIIDAKKALDIGLINKIVPADDLKVESFEYAKRLADKSPRAMQMGKKSFYEMEDLKFSDALELTNYQFATLCTTEDGIEGVRAFLEKRDPQWKSK